MQPRNRRYTYLMKELINSDYFEEEEIKMRHPLLYHMYVGRYQRDALSKSGNETKLVQKFLFQRIDSDQYEEALKLAFDRHIELHGKGYFDGNPEEASEVDAITG